MHETFTANKIKLRNFHDSFFLKVCRDRDMTYIFITASNSISARWKWLILLLSSEQRCPLGTEDVNLRLVFSGDGVEVGVKALPT